MYKLIERVYRLCWNLPSFLSMMKSLNFVTDDACILFKVTTEMCIIFSCTTFLLASEFNFDWLKVQI